MPRQPGGGRAGGVSPATVSAHCLCIVRSLRPWLIAAGGLPPDLMRIIAWTLCERSGMARRALDGKTQELAASRTLNPRPEAVVDEEFRSSEFFDARDLVQV